MSPIGRLINVPGWGYLSEKTRAALLLLQRGDLVDVAWEDNQVYRTSVRRGIPMGGGRILTIDWDGGFRMVPLENVRKAGRWGYLFRSL